MIRRRSKTFFALAAAGALVLTGCSQVDDTGSGTDTSPTAGTDDAPAEMQFAEGVTAEPCPDAVDTSKGCIYLGILSDLTEGPFHALAVPIVNAQKAYWKQVNEAGGIGDFEVDIDTYTRDTKYQPAEHAAAYQQIQGNILALAQTLGTVNTEAILEDMDANDIIGVPASWWSGYAFEERDRGLILEYGYSYCTESILGLDWFTENHAKPTKIAAVGYPGDYGGDSAAGVKLWAEANDLPADAVAVIETGPNQVTQNQDAVVAAVRAANPEVVVLAVGPAENAEIVGKLAGSGFTGRFLGSLPTWNPALLGSAAAPALKAVYNHMTPAEQWDGTSPGAEAMKASTGGELPPNGGYVIGWLMNYPMHAALEKAAANNDLTRAGLRSAVNGLEVDFQDMMRPMTYGGSGKDVAVRDLKVYVPDETAPLGTASTGDWFEGTTFDKVAYDKPCSG